MIEGFTPSKHDQCLFVRHDMIIIMYVDDLGLAVENSERINELIENLKKKIFDLTKGGSFSEYLGIKYQETSDRKVYMFQKA